MLALRWSLASVLVLVVSGYVVLIMVADGFRRSFGASAVSPLLTALPLAGMGVLLLALLLPAHRPLLHAAAACAVVFLALCAWFLATEAATVLWLVVLYLLGWLGFYAGAVRGY